TGDRNTTIGSGSNVSSNLSYATAIGAGAVVGSSNTIQLGRSDGSDYVLIPGLLTIPNLAAAGSTDICRNSFDRVGTCSSSLRYKANVTEYRSGLGIVNRLRPISFTWKDGGLRDVGFGAEDVANIEPLLVTHNAEGEIEGVKYKQITTVLVNAVNEQQTQIEAQQKQIEQQLQLIKNLTKTICEINPKADICLR
ncbi:MAG TPA: tail fiber domain-containing protein, partial [Pyrinomonadaceae bacterium]|nr:tail fiber domain-containing protein [Pyrinomonadaceae bacterium]